MPYPEYGKTFLQRHRLILMVACFLMAAIVGLAVCSATGFRGDLLARWVVGLILGLLGGLLALRRKFIGMYLLTVATTGLAASFMTFGVLTLPGDAAVLGFLGLFRGIPGFTRETAEAIVPYGWWVCWALVVLPWFLYRAKRQLGWLVVAIVLTALYMMRGLATAALVFFGGPFD